MDRQRLVDREIVGGVDTHKLVHVAAAVDGVGRLLGTSEFPATSIGYRDLLRWLRGYGAVSLIGVEGTGSYARSSAVRRGRKPQTRSTLSSRAPRRASR